MTTTLVVLLIAIVGWLVYQEGYLKGHKDGTRDGRLDQHWYQQNITRKARFK